MAATVTIEEANGATPSYTTISQGSPGRFQTIDQKAQGDYPIQIPSAGYNYSYWKHFCLNIAGTFTQVNNIRLFCDGTLFSGLGTNGFVYSGKRDSGDHGCPTGSYDEATGGGHTQGETGPFLKHATNGHAYYLGQTAAVEDMENYPSSGTSLLIDSTNHTVAERSKFAVLQVQVDTDATQGEKADETFTFRYDEI
jgi:hypothetical protein